MIYSAEAILHVGEAGLEYVDEFDNICVINFETCGRNAAHVLGHETQAACVGRRLMIIDSAGQMQRHLEFFTPTPTVFVLESDAAFQRLRFRVEQMGWALA